MNRRSVLAGIGAMGLTATRAEAATPTAKDNLATARGFLADVMAGFNAEAARQYVSPDYVSGDTGAAPGVDAYIQRLAGYVALMTHTFTDFAITEDAHVARGNVVVIHSHVTGTTTTGRMVDIEAVWWFDLVDGLITHWIGGPDSQKLNQQIYG